MTYKKGMTKSKYKAKMRNFWDDRWYHNVSIETWCGLLTNENLLKMRLKPSEICSGQKIRRMYI